MLTSVLMELPPVDLVLYHISPVEGALVQMEVQSDRVPQARHQDTVISLVQVDTPDFMAVGEDDERLEGVCE